MSEDCRLGLAYHETREETDNLESQIFIQGGQACSYQISPGSYPSFLDGTCMDPQEYPISSIVAMQFIPLGWESRKKNCLY